MHSGSTPLLSKWHSSQNPVLFLTTNPKVVLTYSMLFLPSYLPGSELISNISTGATVNQEEISSLPTQATSTHSNCACPVLASSPTASPTHLLLGLLNVTWTGQCKGDVELFRYQHSASSPVCYDSNVRRVLETVCKEKRGCKGLPRWKQGRTTEMGYFIQETGIKQISCDSLCVQCSGRSTSTDGMV